MLADIFETFNIASGMKLPQDRTSALGFINRAQKEVYNELEPDAGLSEVILSVPRNMQLALPYYIGELRGMREYKYSTPIPLHSIGVPQYSSTTWKYLWRNWRQKGVLPIQNALTNTAVLTLTTPIVEITPTVVSITMQTANSNQIVEQVTMNAVSVNTVNSPTKIIDISTVSVGRQYNITVQDVNGFTLAILYNNQKRCRYKIIDVSEFQWSNWFSTTPDVNLVEVLFKPALMPLYNDTDDFMCPGYDDAIAYKAISFWLFGQEGSEQDVLMYEKKCTQAINLAQKSQEGGETKQILFQQNPIYSAFRRIRYRGYWYNNGVGLYSESRGG